MPIVNGMYIVDYPSVFCPETARKVTEEGQKQIRELTEELKQMTLESGVKMVCAKSPVEVNDE